MTARVQNAGLAGITGAIAAYTTLPKYLQWGTSNNAAAGATAVTTTTTTEARATGVVTQQTTTVTNDTYQIVGTLTAAETLTISEVGVFDGAGTGSPPTGSNMWFYGDFANVGLISGDSITFTVQTKFS